MSDWITIILNFGIPLAVLLVAYVVGSLLERAHFRSIRQREAELRHFPAINFRELPADWQPESSALVTGSVVISLDYFKRIVAGLRALFGGRIKTYEPLLDRARREALLRMTESAQRAGFDAVINVRLETSRLASARRNGEGLAGVEMLAFGTGVRLAGQHSR